MTCEQRIKKALNNFNKKGFKENSLDELIVIAYWMGREYADPSNGIAADRWGMMKWRGIKNDL